MDPTHSPLLILYCSNHCPFTQKVLDYLEETDREVTLKNIDEDPKAKEELIHLGGKKQTPCLFIDGVPLYESDDIIDWFKENGDA